MIFEFRSFDLTTVIRSFLDRAYWMEVETFFEKVPSFSAYGSRICPKVWVIFSSRKEVRDRVIIGGAYLPGWYRRRRWVLTWQHRVVCYEELVKLWCSHMHAVPHEHIRRTKRTILYSIHKIKNKGQQNVTYLQQIVLTNKKCQHCWHFF